MNICLLLKSFFDLSDGSANLTDVVDLSVKHSSCLMLLNRLSYDIELAIIHVTHCTDNASGSDIKTEYYFLF